MHLCLFGSYARKHRPIYKRWGIPSQNPQRCIWRPGSRVAGQSIACTLPKLCVDKSTCKRTDVRHTNICNATVCLMHGQFLHVHKINDLRLSTQAFLVPCIRAQSQFVSLPNRFQNYYKQWGTGEPRPRSTYSAVLWQSCDLTIFVCIES